MENNLVGEIELTYKKKQKASELKKVMTSTHSYNILKDIWSNKMELCEEFVILLLNRANKVLGWVKISQGGLIGTVADSRLIFAVALKACATGIILCHNHPSGNLSPSQTDIDFTKKLVEIGKLMEIKIIDHIIITEENFYSFADEGQIN